MPLDDFNISVRTHEVVYKIASKAVVDLYPLARYATVTAVNTTTRKITVQYPDEAGTFVVSGMSILPAVGAIVRVNGDMGARFVDEVKTSSFLYLSPTSDSTSSVLVVPASTHATSERAAISLGDWQFGQDLSANGTKDFYIYNSATRLLIGTTGLITIGTSAESLRLQQSGSYVSFYNSGTRIGYLQGNTTGMILNAENYDANPQNLRLIGAQGVSIEGAVTFNSTLNGYTMSESVIGSRVVLTNSSGYIFGNYINMTANVVTGFPPYLAGQSGDGYMRWYDRAGTLTVPVQLDCQVTLVALLLRQPQ
jgi:hypothetical protein